MPSLATAQQPHPAAVGDWMTALVQPRHIKLGLVGNEQNWPYAAYELDQLRETFADVAEILPKSRFVDPQSDPVDGNATAGGTRPGNPG